VRVTVKTLLEKKKKKEKAVLLTAYDYTLARIEDEEGIDVILVGDSVGMVVLGYEDTIPVTMEEMLVFLKAVRRGVERAMVVADMPFLSYQVSCEEAVRNAGRFLKEGADAVKLEGGREVLDKIKALINSGIPVMGHLGLNPQWVRQWGGYRRFGKTEKERKKIMEDALLLQDAGVFSIILESVSPSLAKEITEKLEIPVYGIGSGPHCDGQILVVHDILGFSPHIPSHAKVYVNLLEEARRAVRKYIEEVKGGVYPEEKDS